jgi:hypothetical protein
MWTRFSSWAHGACCGSLSRRPCQLSVSLACLLHKTNFFYIKLEGSIHRLAQGHAHEQARGGAKGSGVRGR